MRRGWGDGWREGGVVYCGKAMIMVSEVLAVEDAVAILQDFVPLDAEVVILAQIAHIEEFLVVFLEHAG